MSGALSFTVINVNNLSSPEVLGSFSWADFGSETYPYQTLQIQNPFLYEFVNYGDYILALDRTGRILLFRKFSNGTLALEKIVFVNTTAFNMAYSEDYLFIACGHDGIKIYNLSNLSLEYILTYNKTIKDARGIAYGDSSLFIADDINGIHVLNISKIQDVHELYSLSLCGYLFDSTILM